MMSPAVHIISTASLSNAAMPIPAAVGPQSAGKGLRHDAHLWCASQPGAPAHPLEYREGEAPAEPQEFGHPLTTLTDINAMRTVRLTIRQLPEQSES
jgi:hypothetical protein